jgi:hypothetical protein
MAGVVVLLITAPALGWVMLGAAGAVVSTLNGRLVGGLVLPAGSVAVMLTLCGPSVIGVLGVQVQLPLPSTTAVQSTGPPGPSRTVIVSPGVPVPTKVGVLSPLGALVVGEITPGGSGATVSTSKLRVAGALTLPAGSVAVALMLCGPSAKARLGVQLQLPLASAVAVQSVTPPSVTRTVLPASAVPVIVGVLSLVFCPAVGEPITGATGARLSTPNVIGGVVVVPPGLLMVATTLLGPSLNGVLGVQVQLPLASIVAVQSTVPVGEVVTVT